MKLPTNTTVGYKIYTIPRRTQRPSFESEISSHSRTQSLKGCDTLTTLLATSSAIPAILMTMLLSKSEDILT